MRHTLTVEDVAKQLGVSQPTVRRLIRRGFIPAIRPALRVLRVSPADVERYMERRVVVVEETFSPGGDAA